jgi:hypothetical protein
MRRLYALDWAPAECPSCNGRAYVGPSFWRLLVAWAVSLVGVVLLAASEWNRNVIAAVLGTVILLAASAGYMLQAPLRCIADREVRIARWVSVAGLLIIILSIIVALLLAQRHVP